MDAGHAVEAEFIGEACDESSALEHPILDLSSLVLTSNRVCRAVVKHRDVVIVEADESLALLHQTNQSLGNRILSLAVHRPFGQVVVSLNNRHRLAKVQFLPAVGSATRGVADAPAILKDRGPKSLQEKSLVLASESLQSFGIYLLDYFKLEVLELVSSSPESKTRF